MSNEIIYNGTTYTDDTTADGTGVLIQTESLDCRELSVNEFRATLESDSDLTVFTQNNPAVIRHKGVQRGTVYIQSVEQVERSFYSIATFSSLGRLLQREHRGGIYNGVRADDLMADICGGIAFRMDSVFASTLVYGWLPIRKARENLMKLLFALNANLRTDENGILVVQNLSTAVQSVIDSDKMYRDNARVQVLPPVTQVTVLEHQYVAQSDTEADTLFEGTTVAGQVITFQDPMFDLVADGFSITESGANYAIVTAGNGTLTGKPYTHITREITKAVTAAPIPNVERIEDATLVGLTASNDVVTRLAEYYRHREWIFADVVTTFEAPGDVVSLYHPYKRQQVLACMESATTVLSTVLKSSIAALVGFTPWQTVAFEDVREVLTGSGTWTPPEGVTSVTAVLIGPGRGGYPGFAGEQAPRPTARNTSDWTTPATTYFVRIDEALPGEGGQGGFGGDGGRILRVDLNLTDRTPISYSCPTGSVGGVFGTEDQGPEPSPTVFGNYSSASGASSDTGYTDPVTGETFAAKGDTGIPGAHGASKNNLPDPIVVDGVSYVHGATGPSVSNSKGSYNSGYGVRGYSILGGMGGGPAYGANGHDGGSGSGTIGTSYVTGYVASGGKGGTALPCPKTTTYGKGGQGGNGGGGAGATDVTTGIYNRVSNTAGEASKATMTLNFVAFNPGGDGSDGSQAGDGCIILTYRRPVTT